MVAVKWIFWAVAVGVSEVWRWVGGWGSKLKWRWLFIDAKRPYMCLLCGRGTHYSMFFGNNSSAMCRTQILMTGMLLHTTRRIHRTHSIFGQSSPLGVGIRLCCFVCYLFGLTCRPNGLIFKYFIKTWELIATESGQHAMTFSARGKIFPSEMH